MRIPVLNARRPGVPLACLALLASALAPAVAGAALSQLSSSQLQVEFDPDSFSFVKDENSFGGVSPVDVPASGFTYTLVAEDTLRMDLNGLMSVYASSYSSFTSETFGGSFNAAFQFLARPGYKITGYTVTFAGDYSIETPGTVGLGTTTAGAFSQSSGAGGFSISGSISGAIAPALQGAFSATGDITTVQVFDGYNTYVDHYETVLDYCESEEPFSCYYRDEPVYVSEPMYHDETDLGEAAMNLQFITVQAHVAAVPEPDAGMMVAAVLPALIAWRCRRQRRS